MVVKVKSEQATPFVPFLLCHLHRDAVATVDIEAATLGSADKRTRNGVTVVDKQLKVVTPSLGHSSVELVPFVCLSKYYFVTSCYR